MADDGENSDTGETPETNEESDEERGGPEAPHVGDDPSPEQLQQNAVERLEYTLEEGYKKFHLNADDADDVPEMILSLIFHNLNLEYRQNANKNRVLKITFNANVYQPTTLYIRFDPSKEDRINVYFHMIDISSSSDFSGAGAVSYDCIHQDNEIKNHIQELLGTNNLTGSIFVEAHLIDTSNEQ
jgi:hypothetical protein